MATKDYQAAKFNQTDFEKTVDSLTVEEALQINVNNQPFTMTMRTPGDDLALVRGLLHSEDVIADKSFNPDIILNKENQDGIVTIVNVNIPIEKLGKGYSNSRSLLSVSSCGICGKTEIGELSIMGKSIETTEQIPIERISSSFIKMSAQQHDFLKSGGTHAAAAFDFEGHLIASMEDIGRHNAVDKVIGHLLLNQASSAPYMLTVSGRVSYEIVIKCFRAGIPILAAVSAPSTLAVDYSKELGITLLGFCRDERATCYSFPHRITFKKLNKKAG